MKHLLKPVLLAGIMLVTAPQPAFAAKDSAVAGVRVQGIAVATLPGAVGKASATVTADQQRDEYYKPQLTNYETRAQQIQTQLRAMNDKLVKDSQAPNADRAALEKQAMAMQDVQQKGERELNEIMKPYVYSQAYVTEQITAKIDEAVRKAMAANNVTLLLKPEAVNLITDTSYDLTPAITAEINKLIPSAQFIPPQGWEPRELREARAEQEAQRAAAGAQGGAAPAPAAPATSGR
jgi:Skp family chaperone for outer membrane proteins